MPTSNVLAALRAELVSLRLHVLGPIAALAASAAVVAARFPGELALTPDVLVRFGILAAIAAATLIVWGKSAALRAPRQWARKSGAATRARYLEILSIATVALLPTVHCMLLAERILEPWDNLVRQADLAGSDLPVATNASAEERRSAAESFASPALRVSGRRNDLINARQALMFNYCGRPVLGEPFDVKAGEACLANFQAHPPKSPATDRYIQDIQIYERALAIVGAPAAPHVEALPIPRDFNDFLISKRAVWRLTATYQLHHQARQYVGWTLLAAAFAFSALFAVREVGIASALVHGVAFVGYAIAVFGLTRQIAGWNQYPRPLGILALAHVAGLLVAAVWQIRRRGTARYGGCASILLILALPLIPLNIGYLVDADLEGLGTAAGTSVLTWAVAVPFVRFLPPLATRIFVSYSRRSPEARVSWRDIVIDALQPLQKDGLISLFVDTKGIEAGALWHERIQSEARAADVGIVLLSEPLLMSEYITAHELPLLLDAQRRSVLTLRLLVVSTCPWQEREIVFPDAKRGPHRVRLGQYQAFHAPDRPLDTLAGEEQQEILDDLVRDVRHLSSRKP